MYCPDSAFQINNSQRNQVYNLYFSRDFNRVHEFLILLPETARYMGKLCHNNNHSKPIQKQHPQIQINRQIKKTKSVVYGIHVTLNEDKHLGFRIKFVLVLSLICRQRQFRSKKKFLSIE